MVFFLFFFLFFFLLRSVSLLCILRANRNQEVVWSVVLRVLELRWVVVRISGEKGVRWIIGEWRRCV